MNMYLFFGFSIIWVLIFAFLLVMYRHQRRLEDRINGLIKRLKP